MKKDILILGKGPTEALDDTTMTAEAQYSINFSRLQRKFSLSLHYNGGNSFLSVNATLIYQFKAKDSKTKKHTSHKNMKRKINWLCTIFLLISDITNLMKKQDNVQVN